MHQAVGQLVPTGAVGEEPVLPVLDAIAPAGESMPDQRSEFDFGDQATLLRSGTARWLGRLTANVLHRVHPSVVEVD
jgi:hypothetical protein